MTTTTVEARQSIAPALGLLEDIVLEALRRQGMRGATCDEIEQSASMAHQTASARLRGLTIKGLVMDSGRRRPTRSGRRATVWIAGT